MSHPIRCLARALPILLAVSLGHAASIQANAPPAEESWTRAHLGKAISTAEAREFARRLAQFVRDHHLKQNPGSEQRGMIYEYLDMSRRGQPDQFVQGEALDTMHDGAWFAAAMVNAYGATGDPFYKELLTRWQLPFYLEMLNHSDTLFSARENHARPGREKVWTENKEWLLQEGEKGFVPYWWDDGGSVSLERPRNRDPRPEFPAFDAYVRQGLPNPEYRLSGYSLGSSNHLAQDLGVMLQRSWLLLKDSPDPGELKLAAEVAEATQNLHRCRMNHFGHIPMCCAPLALAKGDAEELKRVPASGPADFTPKNHYARALYAFPPAQPQALPGFADDQEYTYYFGLARSGGELPASLAFRTMYDAFTEPILYRYYSDDAPVPAGINRFDLHGYSMVDGRMTDYRSDRKGPGGRPRPMGSRMGPQNMVACGWALQALRAHPGVWEVRLKQFPGDHRVYFTDETLAAGTVDPPAPRPLTLANAVLRLQSARRAIQVQGEVKGDACTLRLYSRPDGQGTYAEVTLKRDGTVTAANDRGQPLALHATVQPAGGDFHFTLELPYTVAKEQKGAWANGIEHGRYSVQVGDVRRNLYLASSEAQVKAWLEHELGGGLRTWEAIFRDKGYIPTGIGTGAHWDRYSDDGGYAHLISAAAQWMQYQEGKQDWKLYRFPAVPTSR